MRYAIVIEKAESNYSASVPDLPGCVATGKTIAEVESEIRDSIAFHLDGLREDGLPVPPGASQVEYVEELVIPSDRLRRTGLVSYPRAKPVLAGRRNH